MGALDFLFLIFAFSNHFKLWVVTNFKIISQFYVFINDINYIFQNLTIQFFNMKLFKKI